MLRFLRTHGNQCTCPHELILFQCSHLSDLHRRRVGSSLFADKTVALPCDGISVNPLWLGTVVDSVVQLWNNMNMHESLFHYVLMKRLASKVRAMDTEPMVHGSPWSSGCTIHAIEFSTDYSISMNHHEYSSDLISTLVAPNDDRRQFLWVFRCFPPSHCHHIRALRVVSCQCEDNVELEETGNSDLIRFTLKALHPERQPLAISWGEVTEMWRLELPWTLYDFVS